MCNKVLHWDVSYSAEQQPLSEKRIETRATEHPGQQHEATCRLATTLLEAMCNDTFP